jgi:hypothetical protein
MKSNVFYLNPASRHFRKLDPIKFESVEHLLCFLRDEPDIVRRLNVYSALELAIKVEQSVISRRNNGTLEQQKTGSDGNPTGTPNGEAAVGYGKPPVEHQFKPGNTASKGGQRGPRSLKKLIRDIVLNEGNDGRYAKTIATALVTQACEGNTHAIRLVCENVALKRSKR